MKKNLVLLVLCISVWTHIQAQSKVFKEVNDDISTEIKSILQDNALVGYLVFTKLEKATKDSFNYRITIMDENLNDIGIVNFKEENLDLQAVSFEQDVLCLAYFKSNILGEKFKTKKEYKAALPLAKNAIVTQFLNLDGKIIKLNSTKVNVDLPKDLNTMQYNQVFGGYGLKQKLQLRNISQKGFACFYGDENGNALLAYDLAGTQVWDKKVTDARAFHLLTAKEDIFLLVKDNKSDKVEAGYEVLRYAYDKKTTYDKYIVKDKKGNSLKVLNFEVDAASGKPYLTGNIINPSRNGLGYVRDVAKAPYIGVFTVNFNGNKKGDIKETFSYWNDGSNTSISKSGKFAQSDAYSLFRTGFKDEAGNTYFVGSSMIKRTKWGMVASSVILSPLLFVSPMMLMVAGTAKCKVTDAMLLKQAPNGSLSYENTIPCNSTAFRPGKAPMAEYGPRKTFYRVYNANTKNDYVIVDDIKDIVIYNVTKKKVSKTIPHSEGGVVTNVYPAKEGHLIVAQYNKKEKSRKYSIEAL